MFLCICMMFVLLGLLGLAEVHALVGFQAHCGALVVFRLEARQIFGGLFVAFVVVWVNHGGIRYRNGMVFV